MRALTLLVAASLLPIGCSLTPRTVEMPSGWQVEAVERPKISTAFLDVGVTYTTAEELRQHLREFAKVRLWSDQQLSDALSRVNDAGSISVNLESETLEGANPRQYETVVTTADGTQIKRVKGPDIIPPAPGKYDRVWRGGYAISLPNKPTAPLTIYVIATALNERWAFRLSPPRAR